MASNVVPFGSLSSGVEGNADLSIPVNRVNLDASVVNARRPFQAHGPIYTSDYEGRSRYDSLQVTLSRQTGKRLQYLAAYTLGQAQGTLRGDYGDRDPFDASRTYGVLDEDRRHIFNVSWNALLPDGSRGSEQRVRPRRAGRLAALGDLHVHERRAHPPVRSPGTLRATASPRRTSARRTSSARPARRNGLAPEFTCDPRRGGSRVGETLLDVDCIKVPDLGANPSLVPPYDIRTPSRMTHDLTVFKNFALRGSQKLQFRTGLFQHLQHRLRGDRDRQRRGSDARHERATAASITCRTASAVTPTACAIPPAGIRSRTSRKRTSGGSISCVVTGSSSSC